VELVSEGAGYSFYVLLEGGAFVTAEDGEEVATVRAAGLLRRDRDPRRLAADGDGDDHPPLAAARDVRRLQEAQPNVGADDLRRYGVHKRRVGILGAGIALLAEVQRRLGVPLHVCSGGIREGAVLASVRAVRAA
jgi:hypothetical protein